MMTRQLSYASLIDYDPGLPGIGVPVELRHAGKAVTLQAKLDTGSTDCIFERWHGEVLGFAIESGWLKTFSTATGTFDAYGHSLTLSVEQFAFDVMVYFFKDDAIKRNVLGRHGFLQFVRLGLIDYDGQLYLSQRDDESQ